MFIETSAMVAILREEPEGEDFLRIISKDSARLTSVVAMVEASIALGRIDGNYEASAATIKELVRKLGAQVAPVSADMFEEVMAAYSRYGKGTGHPAKLNFGDCFSYAMAKRANVALLYKGNDFSQTDLA
jgi:ribonuclease VapC